MMAKYSKDDPDLGRIIERMDARIRALESGNRIGNTSIDQGNLIVSGGDVLVQEGGSVAVSGTGNVEVSGGGDVAVSGGGSISVVGGDVAVTNGGVTVSGTGAIVIQNVDGTVEHARLDADGVVINGTSLFTPGAVSMFAGPSTEVPSGWLVCDGAAVSRTTYANLFTAIGITWGAGNGSTTFNLPNLVGRVLIGASTTFLLGSLGGDTTHTHTNPSTSATGAHAHTNAITNVAGGHSHTNPNTNTGGSHSHGTGGPSSTIVVTLGATETAAGNAHTHSTDTEPAHAHSQGSTGSVADHAHGVASTGGVADHSHTQASTGSGSNLPPYAAVLPIIRT